MERPVVQYVLVVIPSSHSDRLKSNGGSNREIKGHVGGKVSIREGHRSPTPHTPVPVNYRNAGPHRELCRKSGELVSVSLIHEGLCEDLQISRFSFLNVQLSFHVLSFLRNSTFLPYLRHRLTPQLRLQHMSILFLRKQ